MIDCRLLAPAAAAPEDGITPSIVTKPKAQVVDEGETVTFTCKLTASPQPSVSSLTRGDVSRARNDRLLFHRRFLALVKAQCFEGIFHSFHLMNRWTAHA